MARSLVCIAFVLATIGITGALAGDATALGNACQAFSSRDEVSHGGDLNSCGCHIDHRTGICHCHRAPRCGC